MPARRLNAYLIAHLNKHLRIAHRNKCKFAKIGVGREIFQGVKLAYGFKEISSRV